MLDVLLKNFDAPDEIRSFEKGKLEIVRIGGIYSFNSEFLRGSCLSP